MRCSSMSVLLAAIATVFASDVHDLRKDTFDEFIKKHDLVLAEFFAPWCGHCQALAPEYDEAATALKEKNITLAKIDCTAESELCQDFGVKGYPTMKIFRGPDNISPYGGPREAQSIVSYMVRQTLPAVTILDSKTLEDFKIADRVVLVAYFAADDKVSKEIMETVANKYRDNYLFGAINNADVAKAEGVEQPSIVLYKAFDEGKNIFSDKFDIEAIKKFTVTAATPAVGELNPGTYQAYMAAALPLAYIFAETPEERKMLAEELLPVAEKYKGILNFATIAAEDFPEDAIRLNLEAGKWPAFAIQEIVKNEKYPFDQNKPITAENINSFVASVIPGKMERDTKAEPVPKSQNKSVTVIVARNYMDIIFDDTKNVLVEFYAPWCEHCQALEPQYSELAELYDDQGGIVIAKFDVTVNDLPDQITSVPTIKLFPAGKKSSPLTYDGPLTVEGLTAFITENGSNKAIAVQEELRHDDAGTAGAASATVRSSSGGAVDAVEKGIKKAGKVEDHGNPSSVGLSSHNEL